MKGGLVEVVGYTRVSTVGQAEDGQSLTLQRAAITRWARSEGHRLVGIESASHTGTTEDRDGLEAALSRILLNGADALVVVSLDCLARSLHVQEAVLSTIWKAGRQVFTVEGGEVLADDPADPMRTFIRQVMGAVSQLEAAMIRKRLRRGREAKGEAGGFAYGSPPLGWKAEDGELVPDPDEAATVARMVELRREGRSLREIATVLTEEGHETKRGGRWHPQSVKAVLDRELA